MSATTATPATQQMSIPTKMKWIDALKEWNATHNSGSWCIPRKGSDAYNQVRAIMAGTTAKPAAEEKPVAEESFERPPGPKGRKLPSNALLSLPAGVSSIPEFLESYGVDTTGYVLSQYRERQRMYVAGAIFSALKELDFLKVPDPNTLGRYVRYNEDDKTIHVSTIGKDVLSKWKTWGKVVSFTKQDIAKVMKEVMNTIAESKLRSPEVFKLPVVVKV